MNHLDEGTIHAWIDGALDAERARAVESHAAACAQCSAALAEARGLVAGASRILTALDDVPAGVVPKGAPAAPAWGPRARRQWRAAPWVTGIAAALMLGVGLTQWRRDQANEQFTAFERAAAPAVPAAQDARAVVAESVARVAEENRARRTAAGTTALAARNEPSSTLGRQAASAAGAGAAGGVADFSGRGAAVPARQAERRDAVSAPADVAQEKKVEAALPPPSSALIPPAPAAPAAMVTDAPAVADRERARDVAAAGCYAIDPATARRSLAEEVKAAGAPGARAAAERAAAAAQPQPTRALAADQVVSMPPPRVQLDTTPAPRGFVARSVPTGARLGFWYRVGDSLRVELLVAGGYTLPVSARVACP